MAAAECLRGDAPLPAPSGRTSALGSFVGRARRALRFAPRRRAALRTPRADTRAATITPAAPTCTERAPTHPSMAAPIDPRDAFSGPTDRAARTESPGAPRPEP